MLTGTFRAPLSRCGLGFKSDTTALMNRKHYAAVSAGALLAAVAPGARADETFGVTLPDQYSGADYQVFFPEVVDATELVSISAGTVNTGEFGTMVISAIYEDENNVDQYFQIYSGNFGFPLFATNPLSTYTGNNFTPFPVPLDIKGLRIESGGAPNQSATLLLPAGTPEGSISKSRARPGMAASTGSFLPHEHGPSPTVARSPIS